MTMSSAYKDLETTFRGGRDTGDSATWERFRLHLVALLWRVFILVLKRCARLPVYIKIGVCHFKISSTKQCDSSV